MHPRNLYVLTVTAIVCLLCHGLHRRTDRAMLVGQAIELVQQNYVEPIESRTLVNAAMAGIAGALDQHSDYIPPTGYEAFQEFMEGEFAGIGVYVDQPKDEPVRVITPIVGSPAIDAGVLPGDQIVAVDGVDVRQSDIRDVSKMLRGPVGTRVEMTVQRGGGEVDEESTEVESIDLAVRRQNIAVESVIGDHRNADDSWAFRLAEDDRIAYIRLRTFGDKTADEMRRVLTTLNNDFDALVIDVRGNGGGLLDRAVEIVDLFLDGDGLEDPTIVTTRMRDNRVADRAVATAGTMVDLNKPIAVLIDHDSASASEILAAALQDHGRAAIVGVRSYGKGTVQHVLPLQYGNSALRLTVARYYRPTEVNIHRGKDDTDEDPWGVRPDPDLTVELDPQRIEQLARLWQEASYPALAKNTDSSGATDPPNVGSLALDDPLRVAVEHLRAQLASDG